MLIASLIGAGAVRALVVRDSMQVLTTAPSPFPHRYVRWWCATRAKADAPRLRLAWYAATDCMLIASLLAC